MIWDIACMGGTMVKIPRLNVYVGVYYKYQILYFALCYWYYGIGYDLGERVSR